MSLAIRTGIPIQQWEEAGMAAIFTAVDLLAPEAEEQPDG